MVLLSRKIVVLLLPELFKANQGCREKQLKDRLKKWKFNTKNIKERAMFGMARSRLRRRKFKAKPSIFIIDGKLVGDAKIDRFLKRNKISDSSLLSMTSPVDG